MTVLQKIIKDLNNRAELIDAETDYDKGTQIAINAAANIVRQYLSSEEQQLRDAYRAGQKRESSVIEGGLYEDPESVPDLHTYINQLKKEE